MKTTIDVTNRKEADQIRIALAVPEVRAFVLIVGALQPLTSDRARARVLSFVADQLQEREIYEKEQARLDDARVDA